jgi:hypothetical protein
MSHTLKSSELITSIKRRAMIPSDQSTFTDTDFLEMANEEVSYFAVPHLLSTHEEYLVTYQDIPIVVDQVSYQIPSRAIGNKLRELSFIDSTNTLYEMSRIPIDALADYNQNVGADYPQFFYIEGNKVTLLDAVPSDGFLRMYFYLRPNLLVEDEKAGLITDINRTTGVITFNEFPLEFANLPLMDLIQGDTPNLIIDWDIAPVSVDITTKSVVFNLTDIPTILSVGDYVNVQHETIVPQLPIELQPVLAQRVAVAALEALGDQEGLTRAQGRLDMMERTTLSLIDNRVEGSPEKIVNRHGTLRSSVFGSQVRNRQTGGW